MTGGATCRREAWTPAGFHGRVGELDKSQWAGAMPVTGWIPVGRPHRPVAIAAISLAAFGGHCRRIASASSAPTLRHGAVYAQVPSAASVAVFPTFPPSMMRTMKPYASPGCVPVVPGPISLNPVTVALSKLPM